MNAVVCALLLIALNACQQARTPMHPTSVEVREFKNSSPSRDAVLHSILSHVTEKGFLNATHVGGLSVILTDWFSMTLLREGTGQTDPNITRGAEADFRHIAFEIRWSISVYDDYFRMSSIVRIAPPEATGMTVYADRAPLGVQAITSNLADALAKRIALDGSKKAPKPAQVTPSPPVEEAPPSPHQP